MSQPYNDRWDEHFNSIKVRLNRRAVPKDISPPSKFQFHKGTIKPDFNAGISGTYRDFNSIKVRLNLDDAEDEESTWINFNSIKVRLNRYAAYGFRGRVIRFQFHKGTIKPYYRRYTARRCADFNSIKVRLNPGRLKFP